jgi:hypothetical protein
MLQPADAAASTIRAHEICLSILCADSSTQQQHLLGGVIRGLPFGASPQLICMRSSTML